MTFNKRPVLRAQWREEYKVWYRSGLNGYLGSYLALLRYKQLILSAIPVVMARYHEAFMPLLIITVTGITHIVLSGA